MRGRAAAALLVLVAAGWALPSGLTAQERGQARGSPSSRLERLRREEQSSHPPSRAESAARRIEIAGDYTRRGDFARAIELLSEAAPLDPENGEILARLTLAYLDDGDLEFARNTMDSAASRAGLRPAPHALWSEAAERFAAEHRIEDAVAAWELALGSGAPGPEIAARIERARRELAVNPGQRLRQGDRFAIYCDAAIPEEFVLRAETHLEEEYVRQRAIFGGGDLPAPQVVILYAGRRFFSLVSVPDWVSGVFDGKIRVSLETGRGFTAETEAVLSHELAHAWIRFLSRDRAPGWLHEGLAQWCEGRRIPRRDFRAAFAKRPPYSLAALEENFVRRADFGAARATYTESLGIVEWLAAVRGEGAVVCIIRDIGEGASLREALAKETGMTESQVVAGWRAWSDLE